MVVEGRSEHGGGGGAGGGGRELIQGTQVPLEAGESKGMDSPLEPRGMRLC